MAIITYQMELLGNLRDFQAPKSNLRKFPEEEYASLDHVQHFSILTQQRMKLAQQLGKAIVHYRQLRVKFLSLATSYLDTIRLAQSQKDEYATESEVLELDYWEAFGEGRIYKTMLQRAHSEAQHYYQTYQKITLKLEVLQQVLDEQDLSGQIYPAHFLAFDEFLKPTKHFESL